MEENIKEKKDIVFAIFLIFIGSIFLMNTTGIVGWGIWEYILRFWPIFLILGGIKLILGKSLITEIIISVIAVFLFVVVGLFSYISYTAKRVPFIPSCIENFMIENPDLLNQKSGLQIEKSDSVLTEEYENIEKRVINLNIGASKFTLNDDSTEEEYITLDSKYTKNYIEPSLSVTKEEEILNILFETVTPKRFTFWNTISPEFDLSLGKTDLETDINVVLGAGRGEINLDTLRVAKVNTKVGAGELVMTFNKTAIPTDLIIDIGAGSSTIRIPKNVGYKLSYDLGVGEISENGRSIASFLGKNNELESDNYDDAEFRINIVAKVGVGSLEINNI
jgi:predicted membrane protein